MQQTNRKSITDRQNYFRLYRRFIKYQKISTVLCISDTYLKFIRVINNTALYCGGVIFE